MHEKTVSLFYDLLGLKLSGEASDEELFQLEEIVKHHADLAAFLEQLNNLPGRPQYDQSIIEQAYAAHYVKKKFLPELQASYVKPSSIRRNKVKILRFSVLAAASIIGVILYFSFFFNPGSSPKNEVAQNEMVTQKGTKSRIMLPDGSTVVLNADSKLGYDKNFSQATRNVTLTGEAFFDVTHNENNPFIITAGNIRVKVLGTAFNIRYYPKDSFFEASLIRGKIEVTVEDQPGKKFILNPNEKLIMSINGEPQDENEKKPTQEKITVTHISTMDSLVAETSWVNNNLVFVNRSLEDIATELERQFNIKVVFNSPKTKKYRYTVNLENADLKEIMQVLQLLRRIDYRISENQLIIE